MNLAFTAREEAFRQEARAWLEANVPIEPLPSGDTAEGFKAHLEWERQLFEARWAVVSWPERYGGRDASLFEWCLFEEEYYRAGAPSRVTQNGIFLLAPTLFEYGTEAQRDRILPAMASGEYTWAQAWSEPGAGSDLAGLRATATRDEARGGWVLNGQKTWCTRGAFCDGVYGLFRTAPMNPEKRHHGMTYFMVDVKTPGVTVRPFERLDGDEGFAEVFFADAFVPDDQIIGEVGRGWYVAMATASSERGLTLRSPGRFMATATRLVRLYREYSRTADASLRDAVAKAWIEAQAYRWYTYQTVSRMVQGESIGAEASLNKLFWSEMDVRTHEVALSILGPQAGVSSDGDVAIDGPAWMKGYQFALAGPIYAGSNEIQRDVVAHRLLGLPRR